jgi:hypothetical protein
MPWEADMGLAIAGARRDEHFEVRAAANVPCTRLFFVGPRLPSQVVTAMIKVESHADCKRPDAVPGQWTWFELSVLRPSEGKRTSLLDLRLWLTNVPSPEPEDLEPLVSPLGWKFVPLPPVSKTTDPTSSNASSSPFLNSRHTFSNPASSCLIDDHKILLAQQHLRLSSGEAIPNVDSECPLPAGCVMVMWARTPKMLIARYSILGG